MTEALDEYFRKEKARLDQIDRSRLPQHIAVIMDGNGRWARSQGLSRVEGHKAGIQSVREVTEASARLGIGHLTLYAFSRENWKRPRLEVETLMKLLRKYLRKELDTLKSNGIRFNVIGRMDELSGAIQKELRMVIDETADYDGMVFNIALNYGGRCEIVDACNRICEKILAEGGRADGIDEAMFSAHLYTGNQPDPDLLIRTSGEMRISNFLLWQIAYTEIWITDILWPEFRRGHLLDAIIDFQKRERRFGGVKTGK
jgi:undecaprenyl diphosphate synthase